MSFPHVFTGNLKFKIVDPGLSAVLCTKEGGQKNMTE